MKRAAALVVAVVALLLVTTAVASAASAPFADTFNGVAGSLDPNGLTTPRQSNVPPAGHRLTADEVAAIASQVPKIVAVRKKHPGSTDGVFLKGQARWQVSYYAKGLPLKEIGQVTIDDATGLVTESYTGFKVAWTMARGYPGAFGRKINSPWVWITMTVLFLLPFINPRKPFRWMHLDLAVLAAFGISVAYFNDAQITVSVPLAYPLLAYLLLRMLWIGVRSVPVEPPPRLHLLVPVSWLALGVVFLLGFRIGLNVTDSNVIDVGYSGVIGGNKVLTGDPLYGGWPKNNEHGDTYGPVSYEAYAPFVQVLGFSGNWDDLPAAHGAAIFFDLLCIALLFLIGRRVRGPSLGVVMAYAWAAFPFTFYVLDCNTNDSLVTVFVLLALLAASHRRARGAMTAWGGLTKFATLALFPLFLLHRAPHERLRLRMVFTFVAAFAVAAVVAFLPVLIHGQSWRLVYDRTIGFQVGRGSPFSIWGLYDITALQHVWQILALALAIVIAVIPRRRDMAGLAACAAAVVIATQMGITHWFYLYIVWFFGPMLVALMVRYDPDAATRPPAGARASGPARSSLLAGAPASTG